MLAEEIMGLVAIRGRQAAVRSPAPARRSWVRRGCRRSGQATGCGVRHNMPIYEYRCVDCGRINSLFVRSVGAALEPRCSRCDGQNLRKLVSRFSTIKSEEQRLDDLSDLGRFGDLDENDPRSVARWAKRMGEEMGEDLGDDFKEALEEVESGGFPSEGEESSPDPLVGGEI